MILSAYADVACVLNAMRRALIYRRLTMHCGGACVGSDGEDQLGVPPVVNDGSRVGVRKREHLQRAPWHKQALAKARDKRVPGGGVRPPLLTKH